jgi:HEAT repeat protein
VAALRDRSAEIRAAAVIEVANRAGEAASAALAVLARQDRDARVRAAACEAHSLLASEAWWEPLVTALVEDLDPHVREVAQRALERRTGWILHPGSIVSLDESGRRDLARRWTERLAPNR